MSVIKKIIIVLAFLLPTKIGFAQSWIKKADLTDSALTSYGGSYGVGGATTFTLGDTGYVVGGANGFSFFHYTWIYDTVTNTWDTVASFPYNENGSGGGVKAGFAINDKGYVGTGSFFGLPLTREFFEYDPATNKWIQKAFMTVQRGYGVGFAISGRGFIGSGVGGVNVGTFGPPLHDFWEYNPNEGDSGTWTQVTPYPGEGNQLCFAFTIGDKAYVGGGAVTNSSEQTTGYADDFWEYDTTSKVWTRVATFPGGPRFQGSSLSGCDKGYIGLGQNASGNLVNDFWEFDPNKGDSGTWTQIASIPISSGRGSPEAFTIGKSIFTGMGGTSNGNADDWWEYIPSFTPAFSADTFVCQGGSITFKDTSNFSPTNWYWQFPGGTPDTSTSDSVAITYSDTGHYDVTLTAWNGCGDSATKTFTKYVHIGAGGTLIFYPSSSDTVCSGQSITLSVTNDLGGTFTWTPGAGLIDSTQTADSVVAAPTIATTYSISGTGTGGCGFSGTVTIAVNIAPPLVVLPQPAPLFCSGLSAELKVQGGGSNFIWTPTTGLSDTTGGDSVLASPLATTTYYISGNDSLGCPSSGMEIVTVIASPNKPSFYQHGDTLTSSATTDNQWYMNGESIDGDTSQNLVIYNTSPDSFYVVVENEANGCSTSSDTEVTTGINQLSLIGNQLSIYPNPFNNNIFINISSSVQDVKDWSLQIIDVFGRTLFIKASLNYSNDINLPNLPSGVYFITIVNKTGRAVIPLVRQN